VQRREQMKERRMMKGRRMRREGCLGQRREGMQMMYPQVGDPSVTGLTLGFTSIGALATV
jgi:hypothetical protein